MSRKSRIGLAGILLMGALAVAAQQRPEEILPVLRSAVKQAATDSAKVEALAALALYHSNYLDDHRTADSLCDAAVALASRSHRPLLLFRACSGYIESNPFHTDHAKALRYAQTAADVAATEYTPARAFTASRNLATVYLTDYKYDEALGQGYRMLSIAGALQDPVRLATGYLCVGQCLEGRNQKIEAFRNYLQALTLASRQQDTALLAECYSRLSSFCNLVKLPDRAIRYKLLEQDLALARRPPDSLALMWTLYDLQAIDLNAGRYPEDDEGMLQVLGYAQRHGCTRLFRYEVGLMRSTYLETGRIDRLESLYTRRLPALYAELPDSDPALYFRLKAFFCDASQKPDSAALYFKRAAEALEHDPNLILKSKFYDRYGRFLLHHGHREEAIAAFTRSYELARNASYIDYMHNASLQLATLNADRQDYKQAYFWANEDKALGDSLRNMARNDQLLSLEIDHESREREAAAERAVQEETRRHYLQYSAMIIGILTVFVVLIMLGSLRVPAWIIRMLGFFSFIFLFEFIILLADEKIHHLTHGEPWKVLLIKIFLIAILLPMHHSIEKRVVHYLLNHKLIDLTGFSLAGVVRRGRERFAKKATPETDINTPTL